MAAAPRVALVMQATLYEGTITYSGTPTPMWAPDNADVPYTTATIASADLEHVATATGDGWNFQHHAYTSFNDFVASLDQVWTITLDAGLGTERIYTTSLDLGTLPQDGIATPVIATPVNHQAFTTTTPTFQFALPPGNVFVADVQKSAGNSPFDVHEFLTQSATSLTVANALLPNVEYQLTIYDPGELVPGVAFSTPVDGLNQPIAAWESAAYVGVGAAARFTVPEPGAVGLLLVGAGILVVARLRRRDRSRCALARAA